MSHILSLGRYFLPIHTFCLLRRDYASKLSTLKMNISISVRLISLKIEIPNVSCRNFEEIIKKVQPTNVLIKIIGKERVFRVFVFILHHTTVIVYLHVR